MAVFYSVFFFLYFFLIFFNVFFYVFFYCLVVFTLLLILFRLPPSKIVRSMNLPINHSVVQTLPNLFEMIRKHNYPNLIWNVSDESYCLYFYKKETQSVLFIGSIPYSHIRGNEQFGTTITLINDEHYVFRSEFIKNFGPFLMEMLAYMNKF